MTDGNPLEGAYDVLGLDEGVLAGDELLLGLATVDELEVIVLEGAVGCTIGPKNPVDPTLAAGAASGAVELGALLGADEGLDDATLLEVVTAEELVDTLEPVSVYVTV